MNSRRGSREGLKTMATVDIRRRQLGAAIVFLAPTVLTGGMLAHPFIGFGPPDPEVIGTVVAAHPTRWGVAHLVVAVASGLMILAFLAVRNRLRDTGEERWSAWGIPFIVVGSTLFTMLPAMEFAPLAITRAGGNVADTQAALLSWFVPLLLAGAVTFVIGVFCFAKGIAVSQILSRRMTLLVAGALAAMAVSRFIPLGAMQLYGQAAFGVLALWPLALHLWQHADQHSPASAPDATRTPSRISTTPRSES